MDISNLHNEEERYIIKQLLSNSQLEKEQTDVKLAQNLQEGNTSAHYLVQLFSKRDSYSSSFFLFQTRRSWVCSWMWVLMNAQGEDALAGAVHQQKRGAWQSQARALQPWPPFPGEAPLRISAGAEGEAWDGNHLGNRGGGGPPPRPFIWSLVHTTHPVNPDAQGLLSPLWLPRPSVSQDNGASPSSRAGSDEGLCLKGRRGGTSAGHIAGMNGACSKHPAGMLGPVMRGRGLGEAAIQASHAWNSGAFIPATSQG